MTLVTEDGFIDIHSHKRENVRKFFQIFNFKIETPVDVGQKISGFCSLGIHPWDVEKIGEMEGQLLDIVKNGLALPNILALGEVGLDRFKFHNKSFQLQEKIFVAQLSANVPFNKPVIIHSVNATSDILRIKKQFSNQRWIIHGFSSSCEEANKLCEMGIFLSFGASLFKVNSRSELVFQSIPLDRIFLETDAQSKYSIVDIYQRASQIKQVELDLLKKAIYNNFMALFEDGNNEMV